MANQSVLKQKQRKSTIKMRVILLIIQIILPIMLYYFVQKGYSAGSYLTAGLLVFSMVILLWQK